MLSSTDCLPFMIFPEKINFNLSIFKILISVKFMIIPNVNTWESFI